MGVGNKRGIRLTRQRMDELDFGKLSSERSQIHAMVRDSYISMFRRRQQERIRQAIMEVKMSDDQRLQALEILAREV